MMKLKKITKVLDNGNGTFDCDLVADIGNGPEAVPFTWHPDDHHGLSDQVASWLKAHPDFPRRAKPVAPVTADMVKQEASRRINKLLPRWMIDREITGGKPIPDDLKAAAASIREASNKLERYATIPQDYLSDHHWTEE